MTDNDDGGGVGKAENDAAPDTTDAPITTRFWPTYGPALAARGYCAIALRPREKRPWESKWQQRGVPDEAYFYRWCGWFPETGIGLRLGAQGDEAGTVLAMLDVDVKDEATANRIGDDLGIVVRRFGLRPKFSTLVRLDREVAKMVTASFTMPRVEGNNKVEVLCVGQQSVVYGIHPDTQAIFEWEGGSHPAMVDPAGWPLLAVDDIPNLLKRWEAMLREAGGIETAPGKHTADDAVRDDDPNRANPKLYAEILMLIEALGLRMKGGRDGKVNFRCGFVEGHTGKDTGTALLPGGGVKCHHGSCAGRTTIDHLNRLREMAAEAGVTVEVPDVDGRRIIKVVAGELHRLADEAEQAIIASGLPVFQRAVLVRPAITETDAADGGRTQVAALHRLGGAGMLDLFCRTGAWQRWSSEAMCYLPTDPPYQVARILLERVGEWNLPNLRGIIAHPTLRHDGSLLDQHGYDPATGYYLALPLDLRIPAISAAPTRDECLAAVLLLEGLLVEFPFIEDAGASRAVALSLLITAVIRAAMTVAPIHGATAPKRGTGKSFLFDLAAAIVYGTRCPVIYAGNSSEELEKKLNGLLLQGVTLFNLDNLNVPLEGDLICQTATQPLLNLRRLGKSDVFQTPNSAVPGATGNNLVVREDVTRRLVMSSMDANLERPETRAFKGDPFKEVLKDRGKYLAAVLTIVRGYLVCNDKVTVKPLVTYDDYTRFVREPLVWLGRADPAETMERLHVADPVMGELRGVMAAWEAAVGLNVAMTAAEVLDGIRNPYSRLNATQSPARTKTKTMEERTAEEAVRKKSYAAWAALGVAIFATSKYGDRIAPRELGEWLRHHGNSPADGRRFVGVLDRHSKSMTWRLVA